MYFKNFLFTFLIFFCLGTLFAQAQSQKTIGKVWLKTVEINDQFPNPDLVHPGDKVRVQINNESMDFIVNSDSLNHQWAITVAALKKYEDKWNNTKFVSISVFSPPIEGSDSLSTFEISILSLLIFLCLALMAFFAWLYAKNRDKKKKTDNYSDHFDEKGNWIPDEVLESTYKPEETNKPIDPPFIPNEKVPDYQTAEQPDLMPLAYESIAHLYKNFKIVGDISRGRLNGRFRIFYKDGSYKDEIFKNEQGFMAVIELESGEVQNVYARYDCFNLLWGIVDSKLEGTFTPEKTKGDNFIYGNLMVLPVPRINSKDSYNISQTIINEEKVSELLTQPEKFSIPTKETDELKKIDDRKTNDQAVISKISLPDHVGFEGNVPLTENNVKLLKELMKAAKRV